MELVATHMGKPKLLHCASTARIGYWDGRFRPSNFLSNRTLPATLESVSKRVRLGARTLQISKFRGIVFPDLHVGRNDGVDGARYRPEEAVTRAWAPKPPNFTHTAQIGYWSGRSRAPNFLAAPTVPPALESVAKSVRFRARNSKIPTSR